MSTHPPHPDDDPITLLANLVRTPSVNPALVPGGNGEGAIADLCAGWLASRGFEVHRLEVTPGRPSIVGVARGDGGGRSLMLNGHYDTVTLAGYDGDPLDPVLRDGRLHGRGAFDMKSGVAAMMVAAARATARPLRGDVLVCCVADEEHASLGTAEVLSHFTADAGIVTEPMLLEMGLSHKGFVWADITVHGRAAHGSRPDLGVDAITRAGYLLVELDRLAARLAAGPADPRLGTGSVHASLIAGGEEASSYPATCRITVERRTVPGETVEVVRAELAGLAAAVREQVPGFEADVEVTLVREPFAADPDSDIVRCVERHATAILGAAPRVRAEPFWTDASLLDQAGIPALLFGARGEGAHAAEEWADVASVRHLTDILTAVIADFCA